MFKVTNSLALSPESGLVVLHHSPIPLPLLVSSAGGFICFGFNLALTTGAHSHIVHRPAAGAWHGEVALGPRLRRLRRGRVQVPHEGVRIRVLLDAPRFVVQSRVDEAARLVDHVGGARHLEQSLLVLPVLVQFHIETGGGAPPLLGDHLKDGGATLHAVLLVALAPEYGLHVAPVRALPRRCRSHVEILVRPGRPNMELSVIKMDKKSDVS